jgi:ribosomal protein L11 methylase PrmA
MTAFRAEPGSFRDPGSRVFIDGDRVLRAILGPSAHQYQSVRDSGLLNELIDSGMLVGSKELPVSSAPIDDARYVLEHPRLPFISFPYEWPFALLKKAALLQLDLLIHCLERGFTLSDATAYNVQFVGTRPIFIDHLSLRPYEEGEIWAGHRQFCMQFLNPLIVWTRLGIAPNAWFRGSLEGIAPEELAPLLKFRDTFSWTLLSHVMMQAAAQRRASGPQAKAIRKPTLPRRSFDAMLKGLRDFIVKQEIPRLGTVWAGYDSDNSYQGDEASRKKAFVQEMVSTTRPETLIDLGCNSGDYSIAAFEAGAGHVIGFDFDFGALESAVVRAGASQLPFLPLWLDATNPSPSQGWNQSERRGFAERARADAVLALAFVHHLAIARNVPLDMVVDWILAIAPVGIIEFPQKNDPMVQRLLQNRPDIFPDYAEAQFLALVEGRARIERSLRLEPTNRLLVWYNRQ